MKLVIVYKQFCKIKLMDLWLLDFMKYKLTMIKILSMLKMSDVGMLYFTAL